MKTKKRCKTCRTDKPRDQFARRAENRDGLDSHCKNCRSLKRRVEAERREERETPEQTRARAARRRDQNRDWKAANPEKVKASQARYSLLENLPAYLEESRELRRLMPYVANRSALYTLPMMEGLDIAEDIMRRASRLAWFGVSLRRAGMPVPHGDAAMLKARLEWLDEKVSNVSPDVVREAFARRERGADVVLSPKLQAWLRRYMAAWARRERNMTAEQRAERAAILAELLAEIPDDYLRACAEHDRQNAARVADGRHPREFLLDPLDFED